MNVRAWPDLSVMPGIDVGLADFDAGSTGAVHTRRHAQAKLEANIKRLAEQRAHPAALGEQLARDDDDHAGDPEHQRGASWQKHALTP
jgi:hypothetical protein